MHIEFTTEQAIWNQVSRLVGFRVPAAYKDFCGLEDRLAPLLNPSGPADDDDIAEDLKRLVETVRNLRGADLSAGKPRSPIKVPEANEPRWKLLQELNRHAHEDLGVPGSANWSPVSFSGPMSGQGTDRFVGVSDRIEVSIDTRMSLVSLIAWLRRIWPRLRKARLVRETRDFAPRTLALVRMVCLDLPPDSSWRERFNHWNSTQRDAWHFDDPQALTTAFQRAERALTGKRFGLAFFYDKAAQQFVTNQPAFAAACERGEPAYLQVVAREESESRMPPEHFLEVLARGAPSKKERESIKQAAREILSSRPTTPWSERDLDEDPMTRGGG